MAPDLLSPQQVADRYHITRATLSNWRISGRGPKFLKLGTGKRAKVMYRLIDVLEWEQKNEKAFS